MKTTQQPEDSQPVTSVPCRVCNARLRVEYEDDEPRIPPGTKQEVVIPCCVCGSPQTFTIAELPE